MELIKKITRVLLVPFILSISILAINTTVTFANTIKNPSPTDVNHSINVFINDLPNIKKQTAPNVFTLQINKVWIVDKTKYNLYESIVSAYSTNVCWRIDLSQLSVCGSSDNITFFSYTGKINDEILVAKENDQKYLLVKDDVFDASQYTYTDFNVINKVETDEFYESLWNEHLKSENNLQFIVSDDAYECVWLQLKDRPELLYPLSYCIYNDEYYSYLPAQIDNQSQINDWQ